MKESTLKIALFSLLCVLGIGFVLSTLLAANRIKRPENLSKVRLIAQETTPLVEKLDREFLDAWNEKQLEHAGLANDLTVARRLGLALAGTIPSMEEIRTFEALPADQRMDWWIARLLDDKRCADHFAERLARGLVGVEFGPFVIYRRRRFVKWLGKQFKENKPYDDVVTELLTENGIWTDSPAVNFVSVTTNMETDQPDPIRLAARTSRAFLGLRIDCVECHDDFIGTITLGDHDAPRGGVQSDFHKLAAFFSQVKLSVGVIRDKVESDEYHFRLLDDPDETTFTPDVPFQKDLLPTSGPYRDRLASWVTNPENKQFARAIVNRVWAVMFGKGLVNPVDDMPLHGPYPPGLETLAQAFIDNDYDLHWLICTIAKTRAYRTSSQADFEITPKHERYFAVFPVIRLRPEQVAGAMVQSTSLSTIDDTTHILRQLIKFGQTNDFVTRYGDPGEEELKEKGETVTQRLLMMNGDMLRENLDNPLNSVRRIAILAPDNETAVETIYLSVLTRRPSEKLLQHFVGQLDQLNQTERADKIQDIYWTLINSSEFAWNH